MAEDRELLTRLKSVPLFENLSDRELREIASNGRVVDHQDGHEVVQEGRGGVGFHLILDGTASVMQRGSARHSMGPGDYFGEISLIDGKPRSATVKADGPLQTFALSTWDFQPILDKHPQLSRKFLLGLCAHVRAMESRS